MQNAYSIDRLMPSLVVGSLASEEVTLQLVKTQMYADVAVWTRMFSVTEIRCQISRFCCHEIFNETL